MRVCRTLGERITTEEVASHLLSVIVDSALTLADLERMELLMRRLVSADRREKVLLSLTESVDMKSSIRLLHRVRSCSHYASANTISHSNIGAYFKIAKYIRACLPTAVL